MPDPIPFDAARHMASGGDRCPICGLEGRGFANHHKRQRTPIGQSPAFMLVPIGCDACRTSYVQAYRLVSVHPSMPQALAAVTLTGELDVIGFKSTDEFIEHIAQNFESPAAEHPLKPADTKLSEALDVAELIINMLLPDDEAPRFDLIEANPDLVGLFEQFHKLTGKQIYLSDLDG